MVICNEHFSYPKSLDMLARAFDCHICETMYKRSNDLVKQKCTPSKTLTIIFPGCVLKPSQTVFDMVPVAIGVDIKTLNPDLLFYPHMMATFSFFFPNY